MTLVLDAPRFSQGRAVAAITRRSLATMRLGPTATVIGAKDPVAILIHDGTQTIAIRCRTGAEIDADRVESLLPGAAAELAAAWTRFYAAGDAPIISA